MKSIEKVMDNVTALSLIGVISVIIILVIIATVYAEKDINIFVLSLTGFSTAVMAFAIFLQVRTQNIQLNMLKKQMIPSIRLLGYTVFAYLDGKYDINITEEEFRKKHNVKHSRVKKIRVRINVMNESNAAVSISGVKLNEMHGVPLKKQIDYYLKTKAIITDNPSFLSFDFKPDDFAVHLAPTTQKRIFIGLELPEAIEVDNNRSAIVLTLLGNFGEKNCGMMKIKEFRVRCYDEKRGGNLEPELSKFLDEIKNRHIQNV